MSLVRENLLAIDAGNTRTKWALFNGVGEILTQGACLNEDLVSAEFLAKDYLCKTVMIANVAGVEISQKLTEKCHASGLTITWAKSSNVACSVKNNYEHPSQLGVDRWSALIAAWNMYQTPCVVVNLGTAITVDALVANHNGAEFLGGLILPGLKLLQQALVGGTRDIASGVASKLGEIKYFPLNTADAVETGICLAIVGAVTELVAKLQLFIGGGVQAIIVLTGGDANLLMPQLALKFNTNAVKRVLVHHNLVLQGLYLLEREQE